MKCGACGNPRRKGSRVVYLCRLIAGRGLRLVRVRACALCARQAIRLLVAPPLQLTKAKGG
jgi:hypothetical protein